MNLFCTVVNASRERLCGLKRALEKEQPGFPNTKIECDLEHVDSIILSHGGVAKVFWDKQVFGPNQDPLILLKRATRFGTASNM